MSALTPAVFHILLSLAGAERHGYGILKDVLRQTDDAVRLGPGTIYGTLQRLMESGWVEESAAGRKRRPAAGSLAAMTSTRWGVSPCSRSCARAWRALSASSTPLWSFPATLYAWYLNPGIGYRIEAEPQMNTDGHRYLVGFPMHPCSSVFICGSARIKSALRAKPRPAK